MNTPRIALILLMGGEGARFGSPLPKQFHKVGGKPLFLHTLERMLCFSWTSILLTIPPRWKEEIEKALTLLPHLPPLTLIEGGKTRQESSYKALLALPSDTQYVLIHDAVRPFISKEILERNRQEVLIHQAVDTCIPSCDTLVHAKTGEFLSFIPPRKEWLRGQTPQTFSYPLILKAHQEALQRGVVDSSDDCGLVLQLPHSVKIVQGSEHNIKITTELDLFLAERLLYYPLHSPSPDSSIRPLQGKRFIVTGGTGGIGKALCSALRKEGATAIEISTTASPYRADLTCYQQVLEVFDKIYAELGPVDGLINSVGVFSKKDVSSLSCQEIDTLIAANFTSIVYCCQCAKIKEGGHILNISSSSYSRGRKEYPIYSATKAAVVNFTQGLAETLPSLRVNVLVPQRTDTPLRRQHFSNEDPSSLLHPQEVAESILQILQNPSLTGAIVEVRKRYSP